MRPVDPITITTVDGIEHKLLLTLGGLRRVMQRFGARTTAELMQAAEIDAIGAILYEALPATERAVITEDTFLESLPADLEMLSIAAVKLLGGQPGATRPTVTSPEKLTG